MNCGLKNVARVVVLVAALSTSGAEADLDRIAELKKLSLEQLVEQEITTAGRKPQSLWEAPAAIEVLTSEEIHRSGATSIADALRLATGMHVARANASTWAITSRGFNTTAANKMQVFMDGRSLYTPLFSGVFWDIQDYLLDDIDRIEIIRGPNATLWGANAFNGVINIITKKAKDTQGVYINAGGGTEENGFGAVRYGGQLTENTHYRAYAKFFNRDSMELSTGGSANDSTIMGQTGFRIDSEISDQNSATFQGDYYDGRIGRPGFRDTGVKGGNLIGRFTRQIDESSQLELQTFYDYTHRLIHQQFEESLHTFDFDALYRRELNDRHEIMVGFNYRLYEDDISNKVPAFFSFLPGRKSIQYVNGFLQYEYKIVPERLAVTIGSKFEHNDFSGFEYQPGIRLAWTPNDRNTIWAGISRAVRTPTRYEEDLYFVSGPNTLIPQRNFQSEDLTAYELGWRTRPLENLAFESSAFFNDYDNLRSVELFAAPASFTFGNGIHGEGYGVENAVEYDPMDWWHIRASYTYFEKQIYPAPGSRDINNGVFEGNDPHHMARLRSSWDLPNNFLLDAVVRYVAHLPNPRVPGYAELDLRLAWRPQKNLELAVTGLNLLDSSHPEFGVGPARAEVERSVYFEITYGF